MNKESVTVTKKPRKPRTKKADMIKKKAEMEKLKQSQPPKKRGRKPKGGKIIKTELNIHQEVMEEKMIILHLKCKNEDLNNSEIKDMTTYDPHVVETITPYEDNNNLFYTIQSEEQEVEKFKIEVHDNNNDEIKETRNIKKRIQEKLKELEKQFNLNETVKQSACFWCTYDFNTPSIHIPSLCFQEKYNVYGCFCSPECACSYLFNESIDNNTKYERYQLLNYIYGKVYDYKKEIKPAPNPYYTLEKYYGNLTIQEYRQLLSYDRLILIIDKPLTKIYPEIHEDNNEFETIYDNKILLKKSEKINKTNILNKVFNT